MKSKKLICYFNQCMQECELTRKNKNKFEYPYFWYIFHRHLIEEAAEYLWLLGEYI